MELKLSNYVTFCIGGRYKDNEPVRATRKEFLAIVDQLKEYGWPEFGLVIYRVGGLGQRVWEENFK